MPRRRKVEDRSRQQNYQIRKVEEGLCPRCGQEKRDINPKTGAPFAFGPACRRKVNEESKLRMQRYRANQK